MTSPNDPWRTLGSTDLAHFTTAIQRTSSGTGVSAMSKEASGIFAALARAGLDRLAAAMAWHETKNGTWLGPIPLANHNPWAMVAITSLFAQDVANQWDLDWFRDVGRFSGRSIAPATHDNGALVALLHPATRHWTPSLPKGHAWASYPTYIDAANAWAKILLDPHSPYATARTLRDLILIYAPPGDGNDVNLYLATICREIDALPLSQPVPPPIPVPPQPTPDPGKSIADCALSEVGKPYVWGAHGPDAFDCSGLVAYCAHHAVGIDVSPDSHVQFTAGVSVARTDLQAGDILCYDTMGGQEVRAGNRCSHVGIYVKPGLMVNALNSSVGVVTGDPFSSYFAPLYLGARRLTPTPPPDPNPLPPAHLIQRSTANHQPRSLGPQMVRFLVWHICDDMDVGNVINWFQNPTSKASSTFVVDRNGDIYQMMSTTVAPWTNGDVQQPRHDIPALNAALAQPYNLNEFCVTVEMVGTPAIPPTDLQYQRGIEIARYVCATYHVPVHRYGQLRHADINSVTRKNCPGPAFRLDRIITALGGDPEKLS